MNFNKNETESKMVNPTHSFSEATPCASADIINANQNCHELELAKEKRGHFFCTVYFVQMIFFNVCVLSQCIVY